MFSVETTVRSIVSPSQADPVAIPERPWKGHFAVTFIDTGNRAEVKVKCVVRLSDTLIEGKGRSSGFPRNGSPQDREFTLTGSRNGKRVVFDLWFGGSVASQPFASAGVMNDAEDQITGTWSFSCYSPDTCGCSGGHGKFQMEQCR
jgi:hypothetical protein